MNPIKGVYVTTTEMIRYLEEKKEEDREKRIAEINRLLEKRQQFLDQIEKPLSGGEQALAKQTMQLNEKLDALLQKEKQHIQMDINQLKVTKKTNRQYINPYASLQNTGGSFFDKRK
jgi:flagellar protein FliT